MVGLSPWGRIPALAIDRLTEGRSFDDAIDLLFDLNPRLSPELTVGLLVGFIDQLVTDSQQTVGPILKTACVGVLVPAEKQQDVRANLQGGSAAAFVPILISRPSTWTMPPVSMNTSGIVICGVFGVGTMPILSLKILDGLNAK
jgi:hypothetical protein